MIGLTQAQHRASMFIRGYSEANGGITPSYMEICSGLGLQSKNAIWRILNSLRERGRIRKLDNHARGIEVLQPVPFPSIGGEPLYFISIHNDQGVAHA